MVLHALVAIACLAVVVLVLRETRKPNIITEGQEAINGLYLGASIVGGCALVYAIGAAGLWKRWRWAWWLSLLVNVVVAALLLWDPVIEHEKWDWEDNGIGAGLLVLVILLLLPAVRRFIFKRGPAIIANADAAKVQA